MLHQRSRLRLTRTSHLPAACHWESQRGILWSFWKQWADSIRPGLGSKQVALGSVMLDGVRCCRLPLETLKSLRIVQVLNVHKLSQHVVDFEHIVTILTGTWNPSGSIGPRMLSEFQWLLMKSTLKNKRIFSLVSCWRITDWSLEEIVQFFRNRKNYWDCTLSLAGSSHFHSPKDWILP